MVVNIQLELSEGDTLRMDGDEVVLNSIDGGQVTLSTPGGSVNETVTQGELRQRINESGQVLLY